MQVRELLQMDLFNDNHNIKYVDQNENDISSKPQILLDILEVIGTEHLANSDIIVYVMY